MFLCHVIAGNFTNDKNILYYLQFAYLMFEYSFIIFKITHKMQFN